MIFGLLFAKKEFLGASAHKQDLKAKTYDLNSPLKTKAGSLFVPSFTFAFDVFVLLLGD